MRMMEPDGLDETNMFISPYLKKDKAVYYNQYFEENFLKNGISLFEPEYSKSKERREKKIVKVYGVKNKYWYEKYFWQDGLRAGNDKVNLGN